MFFFSPEVGEKHLIGHHIAKAGTAFPALWLAASDPSVVLFALCDPPHDDLLQNLAKPQGQADKPADPCTHQVALSGHGCETGTSSYLGPHRLARDGNKG